MDISTPEPRVPQPGDLLSPADVNMIFEAINDRHNNFPDEPMGLTAIMVMLNIGDRFARVECVEGEWEGVKQDVPKTDGVPKCPNGHPLFQEAGLQLIWAKNII